MPTTASATSAPACLNPFRREATIALGIGVTIRCEGCIVCHVQDSLAMGATREEIQEALGVAVLMGGGPSVVYACEALEALDELAPATPVAALD